MRTSSLAGSVAIATGLLIAAGLASRSAPLSAGSVSERTADVLTVAAFVVVGALVVALAVESHRPESTARRRWGLGDVVLALVFLAALTAGAYALGRVFHSSDHPRQRGVPCAAYEQAHGESTANCASTTAPVAKRERHPAQATSRATWVALGAIVALFGGGAVLLVLGRRQPSSSRTGNDDRRGPVVNALDLSIEDLRREPDARRAIVAAYARMETAFTAVGLAPRPSEAPQEFLVRSLHELNAGAGAASRLTELFELAKFSHHPVTVGMRDEAIDAFSAIRDELTGPLRVGVATGREGSPVSTI